MIINNQLDSFVESFIYLDRAAALLGVDLENIEKSGKDPIELKLFDPAYRMRKNLGNEPESIKFINDPDGSSKKDFDEAVKDVSKSIKQAQKTIKVGPFTLDYILRSKCLEVDIFPILKNRIEAIESKNIPLAETIQEIKSNLYCIDITENRIIYIKNILKQFEDIALFFDIDNHNNRPKEIFQLLDCISTYPSRKESFEVKKCIDFLTSLKRESNPGWDTDIFENSNDPLGNDLVEIKMTKEFAAIKSYFQNLKNSSSFVEKYIILLRNSLNAFAKLLQETLINFSIQLEDIEDTTGVIITRRFIQAKFQTSLDIDIAKIEESFSDSNINEPNLKSFFKKEAVYNKLIEYMSSQNYIQKGSHGLHWKDHKYAIGAFYEALKLEGFIISKDVSDDTLAEIAKNTFSNIKTITGRILRNKNKMADSVKHYQLILTEFNQKFPKFP